MRAPKRKPIQEPISVTEAADDLGRTVMQVRNLCNSGRLDAQLVGGTWIIERASLENVRNLKPGRPAQESAKKPKKVARKA